MTRTAILTGTARGIGRSVASRLAQDGFAIAVNSAGNVREAKETVANITESGGKAIAVQADVTNEDEVKRLFENVMLKFGRIDVVVNNISIMALSSIARGDIDTFDELIRVNLRGTFLVFAQSATHIADGGRIIAFSSSLLEQNLPSYGAYVASKAGVEALVRVLASELRGRRVTVNAVALESVAAEVLEDDKDTEQVGQLSELAQLEHREAHDIVRVVSFLAGPDGGWVSGQVIPIREGLRARSFEGASAMGMVREHCGGLEGIADPARAR